MHEVEENTKLEAGDTENEEKTKMAKKKYDPWNPFPKDLKIKIPDRPTTMEDIDKSLERLFKKKKR